MTHNLSTIHMNQSSITVSFKSSEITHGSSLQVFQLNAWEQLLPSRSQLCIKKFGIIFTDINTINLSMFRKILV